MEYHGSCSDHVLQNHQASFDLWTKQPADLSSVAHDSSLFLPPPMPDRIPRPFPFEISHERVRLNSSSVPTLPTWHSSFITPTSTARSRSRSWPVQKRFSDDDLEDLVQMMADFTTCGIQLFLGTRTVVSQAAYMQTLAEASPAGPPKNAVFSASCRAKSISTGARS